MDVSCGAGGGAVGTRMDVGIEEEGYATENVEEIREE